jgi:DNA polymerase III epsilon subunit-like protein
VSSRKFRLTFLDTETTGLPEKEPFFSDASIGPEITEYALATWEDGNTTDLVHKLVKPRNLHALPPPDEEGIYRGVDGFPFSYREDTWKHAKAVPWNLDDSKLLTARLKNELIAGSNPGFDMQRIEFEQRRFGQPVPKWQHRKLDLSSLGYLLWVQGKVERTGLVYLAQFFGIEHEAHTSIGDVKAAIAVWEKLVEEFMYKPARWAEALAEIVKHSPDASMAEFAAEELAAVVP